MITLGALQVLLDVRPVVPDLAILVLLCALAAYTTRRISVTGPGVCLLGAAAQLSRLHAQSLGRHLPNWLLIGTILFCGPLLIAWVLGDSMRYRRAYYVLTSRDGRSSRSSRRA